MDSWIDIGRKAKTCTCIDDSVVIDVDALLSKQDSRKKRKVEEDSKSACILCAVDMSGQETVDSSCGKYKNVHKVCAEAIDETSIEDGVVYGIDDIPSSRWKLVSMCIYVYNLSLIFGF